MGGRDGGREERPYLIDILDLIGFLRCLCCGRHPSFSLSPLPRPLSPTQPSQYPLTAWLGNISISQTGASAWVTLIMLKSEFVKLKFIQGVMDLNRGDWQGKKGAIYAEEDHLYGMRGSPFWAIVQQSPLDTSPHIAVEQTTDVGTAVRAVYELRVRVRCVLLTDSVETSAGQPTPRWRVSRGRDVAAGARHNDKSEPRGVIAVTKLLAQPLTGAGDAREPRPFRTPKQLRRPHRCVRLDGFAPR